MGRVATRQKRDFEPSGLHVFFDELRKLKPEWHLALGGIMGNDTHFEAGTSYHIPREACWPNAYSIALARDKKGSPYAAAAIDITPIGPNAQAVMVAMTTNMMRFRKHRIMKKFVREFAGTHNNRDVFAIDLPTGRYTGPQWDSGHKTHTHTSFYRDTVVNMKPYQARALARIVAGKVLFANRYPKVKW